MSSLNGVLEKIRNDSLEYYNEHSIIDAICAPSSVTRTPDFQEFQHQTQLNRVELANNQIVLPNNLVDLIVNDEINFVLSTIQNEVEIVESNGNIPETIVRVADQLRDHFLPNRIIIPRDFTSEIPEWSKLVNENAQNDFFNLDVGLGIPLQVIRLPLNHPFSNIIILSENSIEYNFVEGTNESRLEIGLETDRGVNIPFWLRTTARIPNLRKDAIKIIKTF